MLRKLLIAALSLLFVPLSAIAAAAPPFPQAESNLKADPAATFGTLPNGLRYVIRANKEPRGRASLRLLVDAGSLFETEDQRGLAHFLEHMAFNGSTHYAPDTLVEIFQRLGMNFGGDSNASTSFYRTLYMFELPDTREATFAEGFQVFADYAGGLLLLDREIEKERGVILSEKRTRDSVEYRTTVANYEFELGGTQFPNRMPIGEQAVIEKAGRAPFVDFYDTWYRPERMAVVVVGDIDPKAVEKQLATAFSGLTARAPSRAVPSYGKVLNPSGLHVRFHPEPEAPATSVEIAAITPYTREPDTSANRLKYLPRELALAMLNRRLEILAKQEGSSFTSGGAYAEEDYNFVRNVGITLNTTPAKWQAALATADQEVRRAIDHGFLDFELKEAVANFTNALEQGAKTDATRRSAEIANEIATSLSEKTVFTTPASDLELFKPALARVTLAECARAFRDAWSANHRYVFVSGNASIGTPASVAVAAAAAAKAPADPTAPPFRAGTAEAEIAAVYNAAHAVAVKAPEKTADSAWAYTNFGTPGTVSKRENVADLDLTLVTFANGVRLNMKKTDFQANRIQVAARIGTGVLTEPRNKPGLAFFVSSTFGYGGLGKHSYDDIERLLAGRNVGAGFAVGTDALSLGGATTPDDLLLQLQLVAAFVTDAGYRPEALRQSRKEIEELYNSLDHTVSGPLQTEFSRLLANGDARFGLPPREVALSRTLEEARAWVAPQLANGPIEIAIVGDLDIDRTIAAVAQTLGALPPRAAKPALTSEREVHYPEKPLVRAYSVSTEIPKGVVAIYWPTTDASDIHRTRRLTLLGEVFSDRLRVKVREELGGAYSPGAGSQPSDTFKDYGFMAANVTVDPSKADEIAAAVLAVADDLSRNGVTQDELDRAKKPLMTSIRESSRTNGYWLGSVLAKAQEKPEVLDWSRSRIADFESVTKADLDALAKMYLGASRASRATVLPAAK